MVEFESYQLADAVDVEPVSGHPNSLLTGKRTGNFCNFGAASRHQRGLHAHNFGAFEFNSLLSEQGIFGARTGKFRRRTGNFHLLPAAPPRFRSWPALDALFLMWFGSIRANISTRRCRKISPDRREDHKRGARFI